MMHDEFNSLPDQGNQKTEMASLSLVGLQTFFTSGSRLTVPSSKKPTISVVIILFNRAELTLSCLKSLSENYETKLEIILVDNASTDETPRLLNRIDGAEVIRNQQNKHFLSAANQAAEKAKGRFLLFLNNDTEVFPGTIASALKTIKESKDIGAVGGKLIRKDGTLQEAGGIVWGDGSCLGYGSNDDPFAGQYMFKRDVDYCSGAFLLTHDKLFKKMGGFDTAFQPAYYEDTDYCLRLWKAGHRVVYDPNALVLHHEFGSSSSPKDAINLQKSHQGLFVERHSDQLKHHLVRSSKNIILARARISNPKRILYIDDRVPHRILGSGYPRSHAILELLLERGYSITLYPLAAVEEDWANIYSDIDKEIEVIPGHGAAGLESFMESRLGFYETIFISRPHNMRVMNLVIRAHPDWFRRTVILYDAEALTTEREVQRRQLRGEAMSESEHKTMLHNEIELASFADSVISVSAPEKQAFLNHGIERVFELGHVLRGEATKKSFSQRSGILFVGAIHNEMSPNADAVSWFVEEIFPLVRSALDDVQLSIVGFNESEKIRNLEGDSVRILGSVDDLSDLYNCNRVLIAPTRFAAGIPHKIHEAAARGLPVVATSVLAEQLGWQAGKHLEVADDTNSFASRCVELYQDSKKWEAIRTAALEQVQSECSEVKFLRHLETILNSKEKRQLVAEPLLEWTGERFLPWIDEPIIAYEHLHRYAFAAEFVSGKRVLDLASGEGYGSNILASRASSVVGIDLDKSAIRHANTKYGAPNLNFLEGSITEIPISESETFDVIVCFEAIEHIEEQGVLLAEIERLLTEDGLLIISTPNSKIGSKDISSNPFHTRELSLDEFRALLNRQFNYTRYLGQGVLPASNIWSIDSQKSEQESELFIERNSSGFALTNTDKRQAIYFLAMASRVPIQISGSQNVLVDQSNELAVHINRRLDEMGGELEVISKRADQLEESLRSTNETLQTREQDLVVASDHISQHERALQVTRAQTEELDRNLQSTNETLQTREQELVVARDQVSQHERALQVTHVELQKTQAQAHELTTMKASRGWRFVQKWRTLVEALFPAGSHRRHFFEYWRNRNK